MGGAGALAVFLTWDGAWALVRAVVGVGLQEESGNRARPGWLKSYTFLARRESLREEISRSCREGSLLFAGVCAKS